MKHVTLIDDVNHYEVNLTEYKYAITLEPISLIPITNRTAMNKAVKCKARRHGRGALLLNDLKQASTIVQEYGGYLYDLNDRKKLLQVLTGSKVVEWYHTGEVSKDSYIHFGETEQNVRVIYAVFGNDSSTMIRYFADIVTPSTIAEN